MIQARKAKSRGELFKNPFNVGFVSNFQQVFGKDVSFWRPIWLMPYFVADPFGDGMTFEQRLPVYRE